MIRAILISVAVSMVLWGCSMMTKPLTGTEVGSVTLDGHRISVGTMGRGGWYANTAGRLSYPPETRILLIQAIESEIGRAHV